MKITNNTNRDMSILTKTLESFVPYAQERLGYDKPCQLFFESDEENSKNIFGKTAYYDPATTNIHVYVDDRHDKDMLRSISHEMVHHAQNCRGEFEGAFEMEEGYAQKSPHLRNMEAEAYLLGNGFLVRDFEDSVKTGDLVLQEWKKENKKMLKAAGVTGQGGGEQEQVAEGKKAVKAEPKVVEKPTKPAEPKKPITKETIKDHYKTKTKRMYEELKKRFVKKGDK